MAAWKPISLEHARAVIASGAAKLVEYDLRTSNDPIWGLGLGCEGAMSILLQRLDPADDFRPLERIIAAARERRTRICFATIVRSHKHGVAGRQQCLFDDELSPIACGRMMAEQLRARSRPPASAELRRLSTTSKRQVTRSSAAVEPPPHILILGAGPDAMPGGTRGRSNSGGR